MNTWRLGYAASVLKREGVIAYPTEGVWGLGCLPESQEGVSRILSMKQRSWRQGLLIVAAEITQFEPWLTGLAQAERNQLEESWPGPVTWLVPDNGVAPRWIVGEHETVGLRVSDHRVVHRLCGEVGPIVSTSANVSSRPAALTALEVRQYFGQAVDLVIPGVLQQPGRPSEIRKLATGEVIR